MSNTPNDIAGYDPTRDSEGYVYDPELAERPIEFIRECLVHVKGEKAGQPLVFEEWGNDIIRTLFGWINPETGKRRYRKAYVFLPRKNGKSTKLAAIAVYTLFCDGEAGAEIYCAASDADQASILYSIAATMIRKNEDLDGACKIRDSVKRIVYKDSYMRAIPADAGGSHGFHSHANFKDELHAWAGSKYNEFYDVLETGTANRSQPLDIDITTAGYDRHTICWAQHEYARKVRDGIICDPVFLPVLFAADESDDWTSEDTWRKANPNLGVSVPIEYLKRQCEKAKKQPRFENTFRRLHLNQWTSQEVRWLQMERWRKCEVGEPIEPGAFVTLGLDVSATTDLTALAICEKREQGYRLEWVFWLPEGRLSELERRDAVPYAEWVRDGWLHTTPGETIDQRFVLNEILEICERYRVGALAYDPWGLRMMPQVLDEEHGITCVETRQGVVTMNAPSKELERCVIDGVLDHGGNPIAEWNAECASVKPDHNDNIRPVRPDRNEYGKRIDGIIAAVMAIHAHDVSEPPRDSIYNEPGNLAL